MITSSDYEQVEFYLSCRKLKNSDSFGKSDPLVKVYGLTQDQWTQIGITETIKDNLNPDFKKTIQVDFIFETKQPLKFEVWDVYKTSQDDLIGVVETTVGGIMGARKQTLTLDLHNKESKSAGQLIIKGDKVGTSKNHVFWQWSGVKLLNTDFLGKSDPFLRFFKGKYGGDWLQVHETEFIKDNLNPTWRVFAISDDKLCGGKYDQPFKIECWDNSKSGKHNFIGQVEVTLDQLIKGQKDFTLYNPKITNPGALKLLSFSIQEKSTFVDYLKGGEQLNLVVGIDFTASNGIPTEPSSLHAFRSGEPNEYQTAIDNVGQIVLNYDFDQKVPVYGFGGRPQFPNMDHSTTSHCFPCTGDPNNAEVMGLQGIMDIYSHVISKVELNGPTYFNPLITEVSKTCAANKQNGIDIYTILLIITDGEIHDMDKTIKAIIEASELPLSIIIIGVGNADFSKMEILDGDSGLQNKKGQAARDFVQFVPFRTYRHDPTLLAKHVLAEIPEQLVEYKIMTGRKPRTLL